MTLTGFLSHFYNEIQSNGSTRSTGNHYAGVSHSNNYATVVLVTKRLDQVILDFENFMLDESA